MFFILLLALGISYVAGDCSMQNNCNGHGSCLNATSSCQCYDGWGAATDIADYRAPDCSLRTCPSDRAWADVPTGSNTAHQYKECSNRGTCNRATGECACFSGFTGTACQRNKCPNDCSGHGVCLSMKQLARMSNALPLGPNTYYEGSEDTVTWDENKIFGCLCDSSWTVGLGSGETQEPEWFGPDCSLRHCPSADNPRTAVVETDCYNVTAKNSRYTGKEGNLCQVDCANQGICDYSTGTCNCFDGYFGNDCHIIDPELVYKDFTTGATNDVF
mmetsp:Transcript_31829/g.43438  ORF Transcript_31829/g.43438 Transcript_31829/m.43438 type:complete len:274 (-) Transcript_31829:153-974(-)